jgi:hypothetical protein
MSIDTPVRPVDQSTEPERPRRGLSLTRPVGKTTLEVGGPPRANLLPPEIVLKRTQLKTRRRLRFGVLLVAIAVIAASIGVWTVATVSQAQLAAAQATQQTLLAQQTEFADVKSIQQTNATIKAGQKVGASTEIDWQQYLADLQASLPAGVTMKSISTTSATPMVSFVQSTVPLQGDRIAELTFTVSSPALFSIPDWLDALAGLDGFVDATPNAVVLTDDGLYEAQVVMHVNAEALSGRYSDAAAAEAAEQEAADAAAQEGE